jgi:hypothetical protein
MQWFGYDIRIDEKVGKNTFVVTAHVNYLAYLYVETNTPEYRAFCVLTRKTCVSTLAI